MTMTWKDAFGNHLKIGDIVMRDSGDVNDKYIGKIVFDKELGKLKIRMWSRFDKSMMNFVPMNYTAIESAYDRYLITKKSKLYYFTHRHKIPDIVLLANAEPYRKHESNIVFI